MSVSPDWEALAALEGDGLLVRLSILADEAMKDLSGSDEDEAARSLPEPLQIIWLLQWLDFEVSLGSLLAYFMNSHGRFARDASRALATIGAHQAADVLSRACDSYDRARLEWEGQRSRMAKESHEDQVVYPYASLPNGEELEDLTREFRDACDEDQWGDRLMADLQRRVEELAGSA